jgi:hypothetical protein
MADRPLLGCPFKSHGGAASLTLLSALLISSCGASSETTKPEQTNSGGSSSGSGGSDAGGGSDGVGGDASLGSGGMPPDGAGGVPEATGGTPLASGGADAAAGGAIGAGGTSATGGGMNSSSSWPLINGVQWADTNGEPIQAHGGGALKVGEYYYFLGENRNPDNSFRAVSLYRSTDLRTFEHQYDILTSDSDPELDGTNVERPKVVYNAATQQYVMWMHWENGVDYGQARAAVASSPTIDGDYTYHGSFRPLSGMGITDHGLDGYMSRDCTLFVDDDGTGYFLSSSNENYDLHLYRLSEDYLSIEERAALLFPGEHREAPALFKRGGVYFLVTSGATGWAPNQAKYATSLSLTSGWSTMENLADSTTYYSQSAFVLPVEGAATEYLYMGDRWAGAWGGRVNDSTYLWQKLEFPSDTSLSMKWDDVLSFDTTAGTIVGEITNFKLKNKQSGLILSIDGDATSPGADAVQLPDTGTPSQSWKFDYDAAGHFQLVSAASSLVLDVPDESTASGALLHQWDDVEGDHQKWLVRDLGAGEFHVVGKKSGLLVSVADSSTSAGARIEQAAATGGDEQIWLILTAD